ncbi:MAG: iron ABC transporter permease [Candidatus Brocadiaceae bacterium]|nr:iron ABC transporter permease [Candidatus Brocadiaceae bacterium]
MRRPDGYLTARRFWTLCVAAAVVWLAGGLACLFWGQMAIPPSEVVAVLRGRAVSEEARSVVLMLRVPRVLLALLAGGALAVAGAVFQALLRNPLATPHTLGVSAGGGLGAVTAIALGVRGPSIGPLTPVQFFALLGAMAIVGIIYVLARRREAFAPLKLLLAGVTLGMICSALTMFVRFAAEPQKLVVADRWLMGGLSVHGFGSVAAILPLLVPGVAFLMDLAGPLNQLSMGEEVAAGRGVDVAALQARAFLVGSVLTAAVVSVAGPIGFVGLIVPHLVRGLFGPDHRTLLSLSFFGGGLFLAAADTVARSAFAPSELPVGVLTAMIGGPLFLVLLVSLTRYR